MSTMNCLVGSPMDSSVETKWTTVEYWYGIETSTDDIESVRFGLESTIYHKAIGSVSWCSKRRLEEPKEQNNAILDSHHRRQGIMAISSAPMDVLWSNIACPQTLLDASDDCYMMQGFMTISAHKDDDLSMSIDVILDGIENAMDSDALLIHDVNRVSYLGASLADALDTSTISGGIKSVSSTQEGDDTRSDRFAPIMAASFFGAGCVILGLFLLGRRRRRIATATQKEATPSAPGALVDQDSMIGSIMDVDFQVVTIEDEEEDDNCSGRDALDFEAIAREAEIHYAIEKGLGPIQEVDEEALEKDDHTLESLVTANTTNLGGCHSTMDVQPCHSAFCKQCRPSDSSVVFIPRNWQPDMTPSIDGDEYDSSVASENAII